MAHTLEEFIVSLTTIVIRYHDRQGINVISPAKIRAEQRLYAAGLLYNNDKELASQLDKLIGECTKAYSIRNDFLMFLKDKIIFLKKALDRKTPLSPEELQELKDSITLLCEDLVKLTEVYQEQSYTARATPTDTTLSLVGMYKGYLLGYSYSGTCVIEELLKHFDIALNSKTSLEQTQELAEKLCMRHQRSIIVKDYEALSQRAELLQSNNIKLIDRTQELQTSLDKANTLITEKTEEGNVVQVKYKELLEKHDDAQQQLEQAQKSIKEKDEKIAQLLRPISEPKKTVSFDEVDDGIEESKTPSKPIESQVAQSPMVGLISGSRMGLFPTTWNSNKAFNLLKSQDNQTTTPNFYEQHKNPKM